MTTQKNLIAKHFGLRGIALLEAGKGLVAVLVAVWLVSLLHKDITDVAEHLLRILHHIFRLNPDGHIARAVIRGARRVTNKNIDLWIGGTILYSIVRFVEAAVPTLLSDLTLTLLPIDSFGRALWAALYSVGFRAFHISHF